MTWLVFGRDGRVGRALARILPADTVLLGREEADFRTPDALRDVLRHHRPDVVVNAAAWTDVDGAEHHPQAAFRVNAEAPAVLARTLTAWSGVLVHVSTAYVFDGRDGPASPTTPPRPLGVYGASKLAGEQAIRASGVAHAIVRTCWVFGEAPDLVSALRQHTGPRDVVDDQRGGPTPVDALAHALVTLGTHVQRDPTTSGTVHLTGTPDVSYAAFAEAIVSRLDLPVTIRGCRTDRFPGAPRPRDARLVDDRLSRFGLARPDWRQALVP
jgi:dTDP-4-dehydrorhamnose reductase